MSEDEMRSEKRRMMKNVILISFSFLLLFTAFQSMANLQSSINKVQTDRNYNYYTFSPFFKKREKYNCAYLLSA